MALILVRALFVAAVLLVAVEAASAMGLSFEWGPTEQCFDKKSPPVMLRDVPAKTRQLRFKLVDLDAPDYPHGGDTIPYAGNDSLPYGGFRYTGPCPPSPHTYRLSVEALDAGGKVLAKAEAEKRFP
jgi:phosphatidylethanolamine-binding protein (PEBP) family uncharacterized protein